jgi:hypothetical protein
MHVRGKEAKHSKEGLAQMNVIYTDSKLSDEVRRAHLYSGDIFVFSPVPSSVALCEFARQMLEEAFAPFDPRTAQYHMPVEQYVEIAGPLKPKFIHHPESKRLIRQILSDYGCELSATYQDVPRLRMVTHGGYLTSGVGYAHHPHRDTWYSAPQCQINWWLPIFDVDSSSVMAFHPAHWDKPLANGSETFNYYQWNKQGRADASKHIKSDTREQPKPREVGQLQPEYRVVVPAGGMILFSAAQLHSTVPNVSGVTRYSIDFRTVNWDDVLTKRGAPNLDAACSGTSLRDFVRASDFERPAEEVALMYDSVGVADGVTVYRAPAAMEVV